LAIPCQQLSDKCVTKISVWDFLSITWRKKYVNVENGQVSQAGEKPFCSLPCSTASRVATGNPIYIVNVFHVTVVISQNCRIYGCPKFIAIFVFSGSIVNVCQDAHVSFVPPHYSCQVIPGPYSNVTPFQSQCPGF
jgi:hypothetical protein